MVIARKMTRAARILSFRLLFIVGIPLLYYASFGPSGRSDEPDPYSHAADYKTALVAQNVAQVTSMEVVYTH
uniref:Uncharacterized protein n=1 Tax=Timema bartmani TaxID=61472 RepID=A0A7R9I3H6_9NEOP|nr:unnamed protein product [Timema bartmani]